MDHPAFSAGLERLRLVGREMARARARGGLAGGARRAALMGQAGFAFARLFLLRPRRHARPDDVRLAAAW